MFKGIKFLINIKLKALNAMLSFIFWLSWIVALDSEKL
jgi:hypothetical protein